MLQETGVQDIWVECHPQFSAGDPATVLKRLRNCRKPTVASYHRGLKSPGRGFCRIVWNRAHRPERLRASGFVSAETTLALYAAVKEMQHTASNSLTSLFGEA